VTTVTQKADFRFLDPLRVRWAEVDMQRIVFNGHYLMYFDTAVAGYWRAMGMPYHETMETLAGDFYVRKATLEYTGPARYDDRLAVGIRLARMGNSSMTLGAACFRAEEALVTGELVYVFADPATMTSKPLPQVLRDWFAAFEAGEPMWSVQTGTWTELAPHARPLRKAVLVEECGLDAQAEEDGEDSGAIHAVAFNRMGLALAAGRMVLRGEGEARCGHLGRMVASATLRGAGAGTAVLTALRRAAQQHGACRLELESVSDAVPLYERHGFRASAPPLQRGAWTLQPMSAEV
jgi:YbgC/YbaW family acyl-CoA thioester hydrolase